MRSGVIMSRRKPSNPTIRNRSSMSHPFPKAGLAVIVSTMAHFYCACNARQKAACCISRCAALPFPSSQRMSYVDSYRQWSALSVPQRPTVVVCIDGCDPEYFRHGLARGILRAVEKFRTNGCFYTSRAVVPTFTNPNNLSIVTGVSPAVHGISGNFFLDPETGQEVMMNDPVSCAPRPCSPPCPRPAYGWW